MVETVLLTPGEERRTSGVDVVSNAGVGACVLQLSPPKPLRVVGIHHRWREKECNVRAAVVLKDAIGDCVVACIPQSSLAVMLNCRATKLRTAPALLIRLGPTRQRKPLKRCIVRRIIGFCGRLHFNYAEPGAIFHASVQELVRMSVGVPANERVWHGIPTVPNQLSSLDGLVTANPTVPVRTLCRRLREQQEAEQKAEDAAEEKAAQETGKQLFTFAMSVDARRLKAMARRVASLPKEKKGESGSGARRLKGRFSSRAHA